MKTNFMKTLFLMILFIGTYLSVDAHADADRRNKCRNDKKYKCCAEIKGGNNNCANLGSTQNWSCSERNGLSFKRKVSDTNPCVCGDDGDPNLKFGAKAEAVSNATACGRTEAVFEFGCKWPNKWKAGIFSLYQGYASPSPMVYQKLLNDEYRMTSSTQFSNARWDYSNDRVVLKNLTGELSKYTGDMVNDFTTFIIQVSRVTGVDILGNDIKTSLYQCKVTIFENSLVIEDASNTVKASDFTSSNFGLDGKIYSITKDSLILPMNDTISEGSDLCITLSGDIGNYEEGSGGRSAVNPLLVSDISEKIRETQNITLDILNNPVTESTLIFRSAIRNIEAIRPTSVFIRDLNGNTVRKVMVPISKVYKDYDISIEGLANGLYFISFEYGGKEYARKILIDRK